MCDSRTLELPLNVAMARASVATRKWSKWVQCDNFVALCGVSLWRSKTKNFLSISFSASRWRGGGRRREENARKFFGFCTRESASVSEAHCIASPRNRGVRRDLEPLRAPRVRLVVKILRILSEIHSNFVQYTPLESQRGIRVDASLVFC